MKPQSSTFSALVVQATTSLDTILTKISKTNLEPQLQELNKKINQQDFWEKYTTQECAKINQKAAKIQSILDDANNLKTDLQQFQDLYQLAQLEYNENSDSENESAPRDKNTLSKLSVEETEIGKECISGVEEVIKRGKRIATELLFDNKGDDLGCFIEIAAGLGGKESCDFAEKVLEMYTKLGENLGFKVIEVEVSPGEVGIRFGVLKITGENAFGWLKTETGVHRFVRISPYDSQNKRQTCFVQVGVFPAAESTTDLTIDKKDIQIDTFKSSGPGGQHANVTDSAVRITHIPSGLVTSCQSERSQHLNKEMAMSMLKSKILNVQIEKEKKEKQELKSDVGEGTFGNQIRSYVLHPYKMVKDHRINFENKNPEKFLSGELDCFLPFIQENLVQNS
eukprot:snap_masked-scaffold_13-processed-gene-5.30-mRNA-1 protein AED:0.06 eAED:0.06 QI:0/-1/0/1/-1/1/1/0/395